MVEMKNLLTGNIWLWERGKFVNRRYLMQVSVYTTAVLSLVSSCREADYVDHIFLLRLVRVAKYCN